MQLFRTIVALGAVLSGQAVAGAPEAAKRLVLILDASGSMRAALGGTTRMAVAKEVTTQLVEQIPGGVDLSIIAYGHRKKGDCADIETVVPFGGFDKAAATAAIKRLRPAGMTPITESVRRAAKAIGAGAGPATIILVSDGEETCGADPCAAVRELKKASAAFTLHVVGFGVTAKEAAQLECLAKEGGGDYHAASTAAELGKALQAAGKAELQSGSLTVAVRKQGKFVRAEIRLTRAGGGGGGGWSSDKGPATFSLLPGNYELVANDTTVAGGKSVRQKDIEVKVGETTTRDVDFEVEGSAVISAVKDGKRIKAELFVVRDSDKARVHAGWLSPDGPTSVRLLPGNYEAVVTDTKLATKSMRRASFEVKPGEPTTVNVEGFLEARLDIAAYRGQARVKCEFRLNSRDGNGGDMGWLSEQGPRTTWVLPGTYDLNLDCGGEKRKVEGIAVGHGELKTVDVR